MAKGALRAVLAGCGGISNAWLKPAKEIKGLEIVGLVDLHLEAAEGKKTKYELADAKTGTDLRAMLDQTKPDIVFDCTTPEAHVHVTLEALRHGCHVLGEKPLADTMANARKMVAAAGKAGRTYAVIQNRRYNPKIIALRNLVASGKIGQLTTLCSDFFIGAHFGGFRERMKHVLLLDMAIHTFDAARFISGADPVAVYCREWNPVGSWYDHDASAVAVFEMSNGLVYTYRGSWCAEGFNTPWESVWRAIGSRGTAAWDGADAVTAQQVSKTPGFRSEMKDLKVTIPTLKHVSHAALLHEFVHCVRTGKTPQTVCTDNIKSLAMVFAAIESARTGRRVRIRV